MIYVAGPYRHKDAAVIQERMEVVYRVMADLMREGQNCCSPMLMHAVVKRHDLPNNFEFWDNYSFDMLGRCSSMMVIRQHGWDRSKGVEAEIKFALERGIPITYREVDDE